MTPEDMSDKCCVAMASVYVSEKCCVTMTSVDVSEKCYVTMTHVDVSEKCCLTLTPVDVFAKHCVTTSVDVSESCCMAIGRSTYRHVFEVLYGCVTLTRVHVFEERWMAVSCYRWWTPSQSKTHSMMWPMHWMSKAWSASLSDTWSGRVLTLTSSLSSRSMR